MARLSKHLARGRSPKIAKDRVPDGTSVMGLKSQAHLIALGDIVSSWPHVEEAFVMYFADILDTVPANARDIFRSLASERSRIDLMRNVLERSHTNLDKGPEYDALLDQFAKLNSKRNHYVHGLWSTHESGRVFLAPSGVDAHPVISAEEVKVDVLTALSEQMQQLAAECYHLYFVSRAGNERSASSGEN